MLNFDVTQDIEKQIFAIWSDWKSQDSVNARISLLTNKIILRFNHMLLLQLFSLYSTSKKPKHPQTTPVFSIPHCKPKTETTVYMEISSI